MGDGLKRARKAARKTQVYTRGHKKGLPIYCECGGKMEYTFSFGRIWSCCSKCSPVQTVKIPKKGI